MPSNNPTPGIKELAEKLGLSKATVSKALNGYSQVNAQTRQRVLNAAEEMGYSLPETEARSARKKRIGWIYATASHETSIGQLSVSSGFQAASQKHYGNEMELILLPLFRDMPQMLRPLPDLIADYRLDGVFMSDILYDERYLQDVAEAEAPMILWGLPFSQEKSNIGHVTCDDVVGIELAMQHLFSLGHRRIGFLTGTLRAHVSEQRLDGYRLALAREGIPFDEALVYEGDYSFACGAPAFEKLYAQGVTAICCASDKMAVGVIQAAQAAGLSVPEDFSVTGYDNDPVCNDIFPWLTTLSQDFFRIGQVAATLMHCQLHGLPIGPVSIVPPLLVRGSTARAKERG